MYIVRIVFTNYGHVLKEENSFILGLWVVFQYVFEVFRMVTGHWPDKHTHETWFGWVPMGCVTLKMTSVSHFWDLIYCGTCTILHNKSKRDDSYGFLHNIFNYFHKPLYNCNSVSHAHEFKIITNSLLFDEWVGKIQCLGTKFLYEYQTNKNTDSWEMYINSPTVVCILEIRDRGNEVCPQWHSLVLKIRQRTKNILS